MNLHVEASHAGQVVATVAKTIEQEGMPFEPPVALFTAGELLVTVGQETGIGGRNQEYVLAAAQKIAGSERIVMGAVDTDGTDGPGAQYSPGMECIPTLTGGIVDGHTVREATERGSGHRPGAQAPRCHAGPVGAGQRHSGHAEHRVERPGSPIGDGSGSVGARASRPETDNRRKDWMSISVRERLKTATSTWSPYLIMLAVTVFLSRLGQGLFGGASTNFLVDDLGPERQAGLVAGRHPRDPRAGSDGDRCLDHALAALAPGCLLFVGDGGRVWPLCDGAFLYGVDCRGARWPASAFTTGCRCKVRWAWR